MFHALLADAVLLLHLAFILFVGAGALLVLRWRRLLPVHLGAVAWGVYIEASGAVCPLTWAELYYRRLAGQAGYAGDFIGHYLLPLIYPAGLTRDAQLALGAAVLVLNAGLYAWLLRRRPDTRSVRQ